MKTLIRRVLQVQPPLIHCRHHLVINSSQYSLTHPPLLLLLLILDVSAMVPSCRVFWLGGRQARRQCRKGHVPMYVEEEMEHFVVSADLLNHLVFVGLLNHPLYSRPSVFESSVFEFELEF
ncbi:hypothetical protein QYF36_007084 [Acer negundo]|nr:hypothetical protein QYF36_007084 [Acer negundo]